MKTILVLLTFVAITTPAFAKEKPWHKHRNQKWSDEREIHSVPDNGSTLPILAFGLGSLLVFQFCARNRTLRQAADSAK